MKERGKGRGEGKKEGKKKKRNVRTYVRYVFSPQTVRRTLDFFFFSSHPSFFSPSFFPLLRVNRRKVIVQPFEARRDSPGPFFSFSAPPPLPPLPDDIK